MRRALATGPALLSCFPAAAQVTSLLTPGPTKDAFAAEISDDGRWVGFFAYATSGPEFVHSDAFLRDRMTGALELVSVSSGGEPGDSFSYAPSMTPDLRYVAFAGFATNLVPGDTNGPYPAGFDVFLRDRVLGTTELVSVATDGTQGDAASHYGALSDDARYVAFASEATTLVPGDTNGVADVFLRDRTAGTTERVSVGPGGVQLDGASYHPSISGDGRLLAFASAATGLVPGDTNGTFDVFVLDLATGTVERIGLGPGGVQGNGASDGPTITPDGRFVAFRSLASNLVAADTNGVRDVFVCDRTTGTTEIVSAGPGGVPGNGPSQAPDITPDGRFVAFQSDAANLVAGDTNGFEDVFVRDRATGLLQRASVSSSGAEGDSESGVHGVSISADGRLVAFASRAKLVPEDVNFAHDIYVRERRHVPLASFCEPGADGVAACPCTNPPSATGRGCDNHAATGGAWLTGSGVAYLAQDSLALRATGLGPNALGIVVQGDATLAAGTPFGNGVRCADGALTRLFVRVASGGVLAAPDPATGDPTVSERSAALGVPIQPGETRSYFVAYRDPGLVGSCTAPTGLNATQAGSVVWLP